MEEEPRKYINKNMFLIYLKFLFSYNIIFNYLHDLNFCRLVVKGTLHRYNMYSFI